ncbi:MAG: cytochrome c biogenesis protein CcdA [Clostridiales bacterium]|jgi:cytochrome c biogenesis protein CcdA|nr:cytochrome c biogenesis protein CcdA [Clostridiales bacterium]MDR2713793.1 cytochrome c biogenesis protein CcdA [Clostridiales bacterium]
MIEHWLSFFSDLIGNNIWLAPLIAFAAGIVTSFSPCCLSAIPLAIGYVGGYAAGSSKKAFRYSLVFCLGQAATFAILGIAASMLGKILRSAGSWWYILLGILMLLMALQTWEIISIIPQSTLSGKNTRKGYIGAAIAGALAGFFCAPCATPVLVVLLAMVADTASLLKGAFLLIIYALGHSLLTLAAGSSIGFFGQMSRSANYKKANNAIKVLLGLVIMLLGFYMFYLGF